MLDSDSSFSSSKYYNSMPQIVVVDHGRTAAGKDSSKNGDKSDKKSVSKDAPAKEGEKGTKSLSTKKSPKKKDDGKGKTKSAASKREKGNGKKSKKASSHGSQSRTDKILRKLKPQPKSKDHSKPLKDRVIVEANFDVAEAFMLIELLISAIFLLLSIFFFAVEIPSLGFFYVSAFAFLSTFPGALIFFKTNREHGIIAFSLGQIIIGFIELFGIAVVWMDSESFTKEAKVATALMELLVFYQFGATIITNWRPYREVKTPTTTTTKTANNQKKKDEKKQQQPPTKMMLSSESSILSFKLDVDPDNNAPNCTSSQWDSSSYKHPMFGSDSNAKPYAPVSTASSSLLTSSTNATSGKDNNKSKSNSSAKIEKSPKTASTQTETNETPKRPSKAKEMTVSMTSPIKKPFEAPENHVVFQLPDELKNQSSSFGKSFPNISTPSDAGSINAQYAGATPLREFSHAESKQSSTTQGSVYVAQNLR